MVIRGGHTRRRVLAGAVSAAAVTAAGGCGLFDDNPEPKPPDALQPLLTEAISLAAALDAAALAQPGLARRLSPLAADHRAHVAALAQLIGTPPPSAGPSAASSPSADPTALLKQLRSAEQTASKNAAVACGTAPADRAALVGSIAACRATHAEALT